MMIYGSSFDIELFSAELAEPLFHFVYDKYFDDYKLITKTNKLSLAEYVYMYRREEFLKYCIENGYIQTVNQQAFF